MYSQFDEDLIIGKYFQDISNGVFLDIGANDGKSYSNTYQLFLNGWEGVCLEPSKTVFPHLEELYKKHPHIQLYNFGISDKLSELDLHINSAPKGDTEAIPGILSTLHEGEKVRFFGFDWFVEKCDFVTFEFFLKISEHKTFDFINIDCEGHDYVVLSQIDLDKVGCRLICIEHNEESYKKDQYIKYCESFGFSIIGETKINILLGRIQELG